jgi:hypothetical protein
MFTKNNSGTIRTLEAAINFVKKLHIFSKFYIKQYGIKMYEGKLTDSIPVMSGVKQGCILSPTIFLMVMDEVIRKAIGGKRRGINWGITEQLEDLDFVDDICLLSHTFPKMETKLKDLENEGKTVGLKINCGKTKSLRINTQICKKKKIELDMHEIEEVDKFTYLGSMMTSTGGTEDEVKARIQKANTAFIQLYPVWRAREISIETKLKTFNSNIKSILLFTCETCKSTKKDFKRLTDLHK